jgi:hypothetical protein
MGEPDTNGLAFSEHLFTRVKFLEEIFLGLETYQHIHEILMDHY